MKLLNKLKLVMFDKARKRDSTEQLVAKETERQFRSTLYSRYGYASSPLTFTAEEKQACFLRFQYKEKLDVALSVVSSYPGGDYVEFGSHDLYTFRNFLAAFDCSNLIEKFPNTQFIAFDIFGSIDMQSLKLRKEYVGKVNETKTGEEYFSQFTKNGTVIPSYSKFVEEFGLFQDRIQLVPGLFEDTLPRFHFKNKFGFICIDVNILPSYEYVLNFLFDKLEEKTYIYIDEYFDLPEIHKCINDYNAKLQLERGIKLEFVRSAASIGALFRIFRT